MTTCLTCELTRQRDEGNAPLRDNIYRTPYWDVVHAYNASLPGWLVLIARRHIAAIDELTEDEALDLGKMIRRVSVALKEITGCTKTYVIQFAEAPEHPHVHFHIVPRMPQQPEDHKGPGIFKYLGVGEDERVSAADMDHIAQEVRRRLLDMPPD